MSAAARFVIAAELGMPMDIGNGLAAMITNEDISDALRRHPNLESAAKFVYAGKFRRKVLAPGSATVLYYWMSKVDEDLAVKYFDQVAEGIDITRDHVAYLVRSVLGLLDGRGARHLTTRSKCAIFIKGWNIVSRGGRTPKLLSYKAAGGEEFPEINGLPWKDMESASRV